jgi:hypothetical protein
MPRFVLLFHEFPPDSSTTSHWDLMLERHGVLMTWRLAELPAAWGRVEGVTDPPEPSTPQPVRLPDHRSSYLDYEGPVSGGRGDVSRYDRGSYEVVAENEDVLKITLAGQFVKGRFLLPIGQQ